MARFANELHDHLPDWVQDGIINEQQAKALRSRHPVESRKDRTVQIIIGSGAALVAVGLILFVATNWTSIPDAIRIGLLLLVAGAAFAGGWSMIERKHAAKTGHGLYLIGGVTYGGLIFQIANTFHLPADNPWLVLLWMAGLWPLAYVLRSHALNILAITLAPIFTLLLFFFELDLEHPAWGIAVFVALGAALHGIALLHPARANGLPGFRNPYLITGILATQIPFFVLTFMPDAQDWNDSFARALHQPSEAVVPALAGIWLAAGLAIAAAASFGAWRKGRPMDIAVLAVAVVPVMLALLIPSDLLANLLFPAALIGIMVLAVQAKDEPAFTMGLILFVVELIGRYIEFVADAANPSLFFIVGGLLLLGIGYGVERLRRRVVKDIREDA